MAQALFVPKAGAVARMMEALPKAVPEFPKDLSSQFEEASAPADADRDAERHVSVAKASPNEPSPLSGFHSFDISSGPEDAEMFQDCAEARHAEAIHLVRQEAEAALDSQIRRVVVDASTHVEAADERAQRAELQARATELQASEKVAHMQRLLQESLMKAEAQAIEAVEREKREAAFQLQQMRDDASRHELQINALRFETESKLLLAEQALSRQASTVASVGSAAEVAGQPIEPNPPVTFKARTVMKGDQVGEIPDELYPDLSNNSQNLFKQAGKLVPDYFQNMLVQPQMMPMPAVQTQVIQSQPETEVDKKRFMP